jgi:hypothetical protein
MTLPFDPKRIRAYEIEFGAGGQRLGCKFLLDDESLVFVHESEDYLRYRSADSESWTTNGRLEAGRSQHPTPKMK